MIRATNQSSADMPREASSRFVPTPERLSPYLERNGAEIEAQLASVDGRDQVYQEMMKHEAELKKLDPSFDPESLRRDLDLVSDTLTEKKRFLTEVEKPERRSIIRRAFDRIKAFPRKHPIVTVLLVLAAATAAVGAAAYAAGGMELLLAKLGIEGISGFAAAAKKLGSVFDGTVPDYLPEA